MNMGWVYPLVASTRTRHTLGGGGGLLGRARVSRWLALVLALMAETAAHAQCVEMFTVAELDAALADARGAFTSMDRSGFEAAVDWTAIRVDCQSEVLPPPTVAEFHRLQGYAAFFFRTSHMR